MIGFVDYLPRIETFDISCVTVGSASKVYTRLDSGITSLNDLVVAIQDATDDAGKRVGFIAKVRCNSGCIFPLSKPS